MTIIRDLTATPSPCKKRPRLWSEPAGRAEAEFARLQCVTGCPRDRRQLCIQAGKESRAKVGIWGGIDFAVLASEQRKSKKKARRA